MGVAAALSREYASEGREFVPHLARLLESALPEATEPILTGGLLRKTLTGVRITLGDFQYALESAKGPVQASRTHIVRGISLKSEPMAIDEWLAEVGAQIEMRMQESERVRKALGSLLGLT